MLRFLLKNSFVVLWYIFILFYRFPWLLLVKNKTPNKILYRTYYVYSVFLLIPTLFKHTKVLYIYPWLFYFHNKCLQKR